MATSIVAGRKENVVFRAGACSVTILPKFGGKISSILVHENELLQAPLAPIAPRTPTLAFDASDASGWDECLPSVGACTVSTPAGPMDVPDHGDLWRIEWTRLAVEADAGEPESSTATFAAECFSLPLRFERTITLAETKSGWRLGLAYKVTNTGDWPVPWAWCAHPLFAVLPGDRLILPVSIRTLRVEGSAGRLDAGGTVHWPVADLPDGTQEDLGVAQPPESGIGDKLFAGPLAEHENWCVVERPSVGVRIRTEFDTKSTPFLGLWLCYGGWPAGDGPKQSCIAPEPATAPVDSLTQAGSWTKVLQQGESYAWPMHIYLEIM